MSPISSRKTVPPSAISNFPFLAVLRAGERAFFVSEELALEQSLGQRAAVNRDQGMEAAHAGGVNRAHHKLFARSALARNQNIGVGGADRFDGVEYLAHRRTLPHEIAGTRDLSDGFAQSDVFLFGAAMGQSLLYQVCDLVRIERLAHVVIGAVLQGCDCGFDRGVAGHHDDDQVGIHFVQPPLQFDAVGAAHLDVEQREVPFILGHARESVTRALGGPDLVAFFAEPFSQRIANAQFIVDDQQLALCFHFGHLPLALAAISLAGDRSNSRAICIPRQSHRERGAAASFGLHFDVSVVALENAVADGQVQARRRAPSLWSSRKGSKIRGRISGGMPDPSSRTTMRTWLGSWPKLVVSHRLPPCGMASSAFMTSARITCSIWAASQSTRGRSGSSWVAPECPRDRIDAAPAAASDRSPGSGWWAAGSSVLCART